MNHANREMLADVFHFAYSLSAMVLIAGDMTETTMTCSTLALVKQWNLWRATGDEPTTKGKKKWPAENMAIDHAFCNSKLLDHGVKMQVSHDLSFSDHWPLVGHFVVPMSLPRPKPVELLKDMLREPCWHVKTLLLDSVECCRLKLVTGCLWNRHPTQGVCHLYCGVP